MVVILQYPTTARLGEATMVILRSTIEDMMSTGLYLSKRILDQALEKVGE